jgi:hypothetical protein
MFYTTEVSSYKNERNNLSFPCRLIDRKKPTHAILSTMAFADKRNKLNTGAEIPALGLG